MCEAVDAPSRLAGAVGPVSHQERPAGEIDLPPLAEQRLGLREWVDEEVAQRREDGARPAGGGKELEKGITLAVPVAPISSLDWWAHAERLPANELLRLLGSAIAVLVGVMAERDGGAAWNQGSPLAPKRARAGGKHEHCRAVAGQVIDARPVGLALNDDPVERVAPADDNRAQPGRGSLRRRVVRGAVERAVLDRRDGAGAVLTGEGELHAASAPIRGAGAESLESFDPDPLAAGETLDALAHGPVDA